MAIVTITVTAELEDYADAEQATHDVVESLDRILPYVFDGVVVVSKVEDR